MTATATQQNYYDILGVSQTASVDEIRAAYLKLAHKYHPDKTGGNKAAEEKLKAINAAYDTLKNPQKRKQYDQERAAGASFQHGFDGFGDGFQEFHFSSSGHETPFDLNELFGSMFGQGMGSFQRGTYPGEDVEAAVTISLREAASGTKRRIRFPRKETCETCQGKGSSSSGGKRARRCTACGGHGWTQGERELDVTVPAGADTGTRLRLAGEGDPGGPGMPRGDLYVVIQMAPDPLFTREGVTLYCDVPVPLPVVLLGGKVRVPTLTGVAELNVPAGTQNGAQLRMRGLGMPHFQGAGKGDQIVRVQVEIPAKLTRQQREALKLLNEAEDREAYPHCHQYQNRL